MEETSSFLDFQTIKGTKITPTLIHKVYTGPEPNGVERQGDGEGETPIIKHRSLSVEYLCVCV